MGNAARTPAAGGVRRFNLGVYSDAESLGGAEVNLSRVLGALPETISVTIIGVDRSVVDWLASHRPHSETVVLEGIRDRKDIKGMLRHRAAFKALSPDIMQFNLSSASSCQWAMLAASTLPRLRRVAVENSPMAVWSPTSARLKRFTSRLLTAHIAVGDRTGRIIEESSGLPPMSISTIYHGVPNPSPVHSERAEGPTLLTVARHDPVKGVDVLLDALALTPPSFHHVVVGTGAETAKLRSQCTALGLDERVDFREIPFDVPVAGIMSNFDGLVLPSRLEGFPVSIIEAMLAGLPVVATDVGSVDEAVIPGVTGWIVPSEDPAALAAAMTELTSDLAAASAMGAKARAIAEEKFSLDATIDAYLDMYRDVLGRSGSR